MYTALPLHWLVQGGAYSLAIGRNILSDPVIPRKALTRDRGWKNNTPVAVLVSEQGSRPLKG